MNLTDLELESVNSALSVIGARVRRTITLEYLLARWEGLVVQVEQGYSLTGYDYVDDLSTRDLIEEVLSRALPSARGKVLAGALGVADNRFREATRELSRPLTLGGNAREGWWWLRAPMDLSGELAADILTEG